MRAVAQDGDSDLLRLLVHIVAADMAYLQGNIPKAQEELARGTGFSASFGPAEPLLISHRVRAWCAVLSGNPEQAIELTEHGITLGLRHGLARLTFSLIGQQVTILIHAGRVPEARKLAARWGVFDDSWQSRFQPASESLNAVHRRILAEIAIAEGRAQEAITQLHLQERRQRNRVALSDALRLRLLKAHALAQAEKADDAAREISRAAQMAQDSGLVVPFMEYARFAAPLLRDVIARRAATDTPPELLKASAEAQLLARIDQTAPSILPPDPEDDPEPDALTEREIELLQLIESGLTNAQIAAHLVISVATVKWHLYNAFQKLGVRNRMGALAAARKHGLL
ncbi:LuxR C-terminal-related transcriptional regulator [Roseobacter sp. HKCCA2468]|uniref:LuxR C-terminal-related transcriptional regulator n=1 Tax=Roseobacter sp. HKCCA2468 TaxID=3120342 RepID=UPI0030EF4BFD